MTEPYKNIAETNQYILFKTESGALWKVEREELVNHFYRYNRNDDEFDYDGWNYATPIGHETIKELYERYLLEEQA
jgi:hypothetical protein